MEQEKSPTQVALEDANGQCSKICFEIGRLHWQMKLNQQEAEDYKVQLHNLEVDLSKAAEAYKKAQKTAAAEYQQKQPTKEPALEVVQ